MTSSPSTESEQSSQPTVVLTTKIAYALPALSLAAMGLIFYVYLPKFYAESFGVNLTFLGGVILASRIFDAILDPTIGALSDSTQSRLGRRHSWINWSTLPLAISFVALLSPSYFGVSAAYLEWWMAIGTFIFFIFWTAFVVPYESLGTELTTDQQQNTSIFAWRDGALTAGNIVGATLPLFLGGTFIAMQNSQELLFSSTALLLAGLLILCSLTCLLKVTKPVVNEAQRPGLPKLIEILSLLKFTPFRTLLVSYTIMGFGAALPATLILFYVQDVLGSDKGGAYLILYLIIGLLFFPLCPALANRISKKATYLTSIGVNTGAFIGVLLLGQGDEIAYAVLVAISGIGLGGTLALPSSMQADSIQLYERLHGLRREGQFIGLWSIAKKLTAALGAGVALPILDLAGYVAGSPNPTSSLMLSILYAGIPCVCNIVAAYWILDWELVEQSLR